MTPSCSQSAGAFAAMHSSTIAGNSSPRRNTSTRSTGPHDARSGTAATPATSTAPPIATALIAWIESIA